MADCRRLRGMPYPDNLIQEGETLALDLRPHWWFFSRNILTGIPLAIILIVVLNSGTPTGSRSTAASSSGWWPSPGPSGSGSSTSSGA